MSKMKILFVTRKYPPAVGGMELFAYDLSNALMAKTPVKLIKWAGTGRPAAVLFALPSLFIRSFLALSRGGIDVIHLNDGVLAPMGYVLSKIFHKPYVVVINGLDITYSNPLFQAVVPRAVARANAVVCISRASAAAAKRHGVPEVKIHQLPLAVNDEIYGKADREDLLMKLELPPNSQLLLSVGRLVTRKGVAWFINNVLPKLTQRYPDLVYLVVGEGEDQSKIEAAIARHRLAAYVRLLGRAEGDLLAAAYNGADVYVMPNIHVSGDMEGFGLVLLEAALCARPIVASDLEGIKDAVTDGKNGVLVKSGDAADFVEQISSFLDNPKVAKQFGLKSRRYTLANYSWDKIADRYLELYEQVG